MNTQPAPGPRSAIPHAAWSALVTLAMAAGLLLAPARPAAAHPPAQGADLVATFEQAMAVFNRSDLGGLQQLLDPGFHDIIADAPPGLPPEFYDSDVAAFVHASSEHIQVTLSGCHQTAPDTVVCADTLQGGDLPPLPHIWSETIAVTYAGTKMVHMVETLSPQTRDELAQAVAAPGMPSTGAPEAAWGPAALRLCMLLLCLGVGIRRVRRAGRA